MVNWAMYRLARAIALRRCNAPQKRTLVGPGGYLEGGQLLPGFRYPIADLFKETDWAD